ncbi:hypothetical protein PR001_g7415 [Phytophthora rubi]|uniref:Integrase zinc-binding domain-containing protein n=1 Tax=Phytophthora rubi TaxID=129364 RepID=A0A6A3NF43_9STRA|nr:hypothetical protein PR001_g7415 [Phytophthora rubi]
MARWLSFFAEYNFVVHYKPGINATVSTPFCRCVSKLLKRTKRTPSIRYLRNPTADTFAKLTRPERDAIKRYDLDGDLLTYAIDTFDTPRVFIHADGDLRARLVHEYHDAPAGGHLRREKTFTALSRDFFWPSMYKCIRKWVRSCEIWQRVKPAVSNQAPLRPLPIATSAWRSASMDFIFVLPHDAEGRTGVLVFVDRFSKMVHLAPIAAEVTADESAELFHDLVFATTACRSPLYQIVIPASHPRFDVLCSYATSFASWSSFLPMAEFALNNSTHTSTGLTPFIVNDARHPRVPALLVVRSSNAAAVSTLGRGGGGNGTDIEVGAGIERTSAAPVVDVASPATSAVANFAPAATPRPIDCAAVSEFLLHR